MATDTIETPEILLKAADVIEARGWIQGAYAHTDGVCALGAIAVAVGIGTSTAAIITNRTCCKVVEDFERWLGLADNADVTGWNDEDDRTAEQVTAVLRECAAALTGGAR
jgi:hypothetical protein